MSSALIHELEQLVSKYKDDPNYTMYSPSQFKVVVRYLISYLNPTEFKEWTGLFVFPQGTSIEAVLNHATSNFPKKFRVPDFTEPIVYFKGGPFRRVEVADLSADVSTVFGDRVTMEIMNVPDYFKMRKRASDVAFFKGFVTFIVSAIGIIFLAIMFARIFRRIKPYKAPSKK